MRFDKRVKIALGLGAEAELLGEPVFVDVAVA